MNSNRAANFHGTVIAVVGAGGGAGASVLAATLADTAHRSGRKVLLVDADPFGGGLDVVLGWEDRPGHRWPHLAGRIHSGDVADALAAAPSQGKLTVLAHDRHHHCRLSYTTMAAVLDAARGVYQLVVIDIPRYLDDAARTALTIADHTLLVATNQLHTVASAAQVAKALTVHCPYPRLVIRTTLAGQLTAPQITDSLKLPLAGVIRGEPRLAERIERRGMYTNDRGPLVALCRKLTTELCPTSRQAA